MNILGLSEEQMRAGHERYHRQNPDAARSRCHQCKLDTQRENARAVRFVCQCVREDSTITIKDLAGAVERGPSWVRRILKENGLTAPEAPRPVWLPKSQRPCTNCGHVRCHHCRGKSPRLHVNPGILGAYPCPMRVHCKGVVELPGEQFTNCSCVHFTTRGRG